MGHVRAVYDYSGLGHAVHPLCLSWTSHSRRLARRNRTSSLEASDESPAAPELAPREPSTPAP
jgi:hypothetical protein